MAELLVRNLLDHAQAARYLKRRLGRLAVNEGTLKNWSRPSFRRRRVDDTPIVGPMIGRRRYWRRQDLDAWIARRVSGDGAFERRAVE